MTVFNGILAERLATVIFPVSQAIVLIVEVKLTGFQRLVRAVVPVVVPIPVDARHDYISSTASTPSSARPFLTSCPIWLAR